MIAGGSTAIFDNGFDPSSPTVFLWDASVINAGALTGSFSSIGVPTTAAGIIKTDQTATSFIVLHDIFDVDSNESVDSDDIIAFFTLWDMGDNPADIDGDGAVDSNDIILFFAGWDAGGQAAGCLPGEAARRGARRGSGVAKEKRASQNHGGLAFARAWANAVNDALSPRSLGSARRTRQIGWRSGPESSTNPGMDAHSYESPNTGFSTSKPTSRQCARKRNGWGSTTQYSGTPKAS